MKILFYDIQGKLNTEINRDNEFSVRNLSESEAWFGVFHAGGGEVPSFLKTYEDRTGAISSCIALGGGALFISSSPWGGLGSESEAVDNERRFPGNRVHFLRAPCPSVDSPAANRVMGFLEVVKDFHGGESIPWSLLDAKCYPKNLVAVYVLLKAFELYPEKTDVFAVKWKQIDENWRQDLLAAASVEYENGSDATQFAGSLNFEKDLFERGVNSKDYVSLMSQIENFLSEQTASRNR